MKNSPKSLSQAAGRNPSRRRQHPLPRLPLPSPLPQGTVGRSPAGVGGGGASSPSSHGGRDARRDERAGSAAFTRGARGGASGGRALGTAMRRRGGGCVVMVVGRAGAVGWRGGWLRCRLRQIRRLAARLEAPAGSAGLAQGGARGGLGLVLP